MPFIVIFFHVIDIERRLCERHIKFFITSKQSEFLSVLFNIFKAFVAIFLAVFSWCGGCRTRRATAVIHIVRRPSYELYDGRRTFTFSTRLFLNGSVKAVSQLSIEKGKALVRGMGSVVTNKPLFNNLFVQSFFRIFAHV